MWTWRLREMARTDQPGEAAATDHFPRVDAASQELDGGPRWS